ncbi:hypothetical protein CBP52_15620 [Cellulomonas sp. PSBB021]|nr:hypothetical protein CBP52_15620 [Cellulomonas sp. PSBB021]
MPDAGEARVRPGPPGHTVMAWFDERQTHDLRCECGWELRVASRDNVTAGIVARVGAETHQALAAHAGRLEHP